MIKRVCEKKQGGCPKSSQSCHFNQREESYNLDYETSPCVGVINCMLIYYFLDSLVYP